MIALSSHCCGFELGLGHVEQAKLCLQVGFFRGSILMALSLLHTYILLSTIATTQKRGRTDPGLLLGPS